MIPVGPDETDLPGPGSDRQFGIVIALALVVVGAWPLWRGAPVHWWALAAAGIFFVTGTFAPRLLAPLNLLWFRLGQLLHRVTTPLLLGATFYLSVTPIAVLMRLCGKDVLSLRKKPELASYWTERSEASAAQSMKNQF